MGDFDGMPALKSLDEDDLVIKVKEEPIEQNDFEAKKIKLDHPDLMISDHDDAIAETIKVEIDPEDAVIMHYQDDSSDDNEDHFKNVFKVKEENTEGDENYHNIKVENFEYENEISEEDEILRNTAGQKI